MLTTEHPRTATAVMNTLPTYELRLQIGSGEQRLMAIPWGKHSIGSGPRCSLRLEYAGVGPLECLIVQDESGLRVRRWSDNTALNGQTFDDARLAPGDVLTIGPVELEVIVRHSEDIGADSRWSESDGWETDAPPTDDAVPEFAVDPPQVDPSRVVDESRAEHAFELSPQVLQPTEPDLGWDASEPASPQLWTEDEAAVPAAALDLGTDGSERDQTPTVRIRRSRRRPTALRRQRKQFHQLIARIDELERTIAESLAVISPAAEEPVDDPNASRDGSAAADHERRQQELESQLAQVRDQLAVRDRELQQARYSIDVLERQLIDSQRTMHTFAEERLTWESQFNDLEARLADYVERIQELENQLDGVRGCPTESAPSAVAPNIDWAVEPPAEPSTSADAVVTETVTDSADDTSIAGGAIWADAAEPAVEEVVSVEVTEGNPPADPVDPAATVEESPEMDAALDHLRGLSIWREEPPTASEPPTEVEPTADETTSPVPSSPPASFIDRYAHLFPSDDAPADSPAKPVEPARHVPPAVPEPAPSPVAGGSEDEESVEQYMAKLLERMRGPANVAPTVDDDVDFADVSSGADSPEPQPEEDAASIHEPITDLAELKTKPSISEQASHRQAMRELAMQSARHAIGVHASRKLRRNVRTRSIVAVLGAAVAAYLLITAPTWQSLQFAGACVAGFVALYWGKLTLSTIFEGLRLGAFDDYDEEIDADKAIHPPLPIDVEPAEHEGTRLEASRGADVVEISQVIAEPDSVEHATKAPEGDAHSVRTAEAAELPAAL